MLSPEIRSKSESRWMLIQTKSNWAVPETSQKIKRIELIITKICSNHMLLPPCLTRFYVALFIQCLSFPHLLFFGSPPFYRDVNLATGWNNVRKRQVVMIYSQAMVASIESQLQHLSDDDDSSSLSDREERRLTRPQATAPSYGPTDGGYSLVRWGSLEEDLPELFKKTNCSMIWADGASFFSK